MTYVSWAALYEGASDQAYYGILLPRVMEEMIRRYGRRHATIPNIPSVVFPRGAVEKVAAEACAAQEAFHIIFVQADTGGRAQATGLPQRSSAYCHAMYERCAFKLVRCVLIAPRHETEAWVICDPHAVTGALGYRGAWASLGLPEDAATAERLSDPKSTLNDAMNAIRGRRRRDSASVLYPAIAQRQDLELLRQSQSFAAFERHLHLALADLGCIDRGP